MLKCYFVIDIPNFTFFSKYGGAHICKCFNLIISWHPCVFWNWHRLECVHKWIKVKKLTTVKCKLIFYIYIYIYIYTNLILIMIVFINKFLLWFYLHIKLSLFFFFLKYGVTRFIEDLNIMVKYNNHSWGLG